MAKYTMELVTVMEAITGLSESVEYPGLDSLIAQARPLIFDFTYPIFDAAYKEPLETKILMEYMFYEISDTPVSRWKWWLKAELNKIMPYYNQLYESQLLKFDPLHTMDYKRNYNRTVNGTVDNKGNETNNRTASNQNNMTGTDTTDVKNNGTESNVNKFADTPQGALENVLDGTYLTSATANDNTVSNTSDTTFSTNRQNDISVDETDTRNFTSNSTAKDLEDYIENYVGLNGKSGSQLLTEFRNTFLNIDEMILRDLKKLFWTIW